ncbi:flagellar basal-body rod modification protein FlgD [Roseovarius lutimaris]|uniref:Basal-body rod modification protein FlgD n=1 Tax=Roseovarius lutimaris TaxID=1005928 RepID=A0A1I5EUF3_9RHOB|nr:flagellar hook capping FlgD N-terminal domain-containing protein [Roseovarius lutimaris]SFO14681.1 flagellar basal-body rod modification protein FlgD [Roseovarius lutimaris]
MDVTSATQPAATGTTNTAANAASNSQSGGALNSDFETFLKMLTTQMRNQDPLNPVESADFAVQLATFSTVEQQVQTNDILSGLGARLDTLGMGQLSGWIGMEARAAGPVSFKGDPVTLTAEVDPAADAAELVVSDAQGVIVQRLDIPAQSGRVEWSGLDSAGIPLRDGNYNISVHSMSQSETIAQHDAQVSGRITEARLDGGEINLVMASGQTIAASQVLGLRPSES